jgi:hypothetical protein
LQSVGAGVHTRSSVKEQRQVPHGY